MYKAGFASERLMYDRESEIKWMSGSTMQLDGATGPQVTTASAALLVHVLPASHSAAFSV